MMKLKNKKLMLTLLLFIFISSITVVSAVDVSDNTTSTDYQVSTVETISVDEQPVGEYNNIESNVNEAKEISKDTPVKSLNGVTHTINSESYSTYFTNGILNNAAQDGDVILIDDTFEDSSFIFDKSITLTSTQNGILKNCIITFNSNADYSNVTNLNIVNIDDDANDGINVYSATNMTIEDNTIYIDSNNTAKGITLNNADGTIIYNNTITVNAYTNEVTYYYEPHYFNPAGTVETAGIGVYNSSYTNIESNTVSMSSTGYHPDRGTLVGIAVQGNIVDNSSLSLYPVGVFNNTIKNNIVNLDGDLYAYGITLHYYAINNMIINNTISADSSTKFYVCGIQASYLVQYTQIYNNKINLTALNFTYGINTQGIPGYNGYNDFYNNSINLSSKYNRGIESYNGIYDKIRYNVILVDGDYSNGIGLGGIVGNNITYNVINSTGTIFTLNTSTYDELPFKTDGIYVNSVRYYDQNGNVQTSLSGYNNIKLNYIITNGAYAIDLHAYYNNITNNYINSSSRYGNNAVNRNTNGSNTCNNNRAYINPYFLNNRLLLKSNNLQSTMLKSSGLEDNGVTTHVITNDNWRTFFSNIIKDNVDPREGQLLGLNSSLVSDNDVLDFQGEISIDQHILIDKSVNITSTTNDGKISSSGNVFEINNNGSHSNLTNICLYNTQLILYKADYINIDHINVTTENCYALGNGRGVTSIREGCDYINITNSYFYVFNNGGSSNLVLCGAGFVNVDNNTIHSVSDPSAGAAAGVGNVVYLNGYNVDNATNQFINITNNDIAGPTDDADICYLVALMTGNDVLLKGNNLTYTGHGVVMGVPNLRIEGNNFNNITNMRVSAAEIINNTGINNFIIESGAKLVTDNEINRVFSIYGEKGLIVSNNVINVNTDPYYGISNNIVSETLVFENNTVDADIPLKLETHHAIVQNNTITTTADYSINLTGSAGSIVRNNTLIASESSGDSSVYGPGDYIENNNPTDITEYTVESVDDLWFVLDMIESGECETDEAIIYLENFDINDFANNDYAITLNAPNKKVIIDGSRLNNNDCDIKLSKSMVDSVSEGSTLIIKNLKMTIKRESLTSAASISGSHVEGNMSYENCFIQTLNPNLMPMGYNPGNAFINNTGTGYVSIKACTIIFNTNMMGKIVNYYKSLTSGNNVYIVDSIILGSNLNLYDADNLNTLVIRQNYIDSYDKTTYPHVKDAIVVMVNGVVSKNLIQVNGNEKVVIKMVVDREDSYDDPIHAIGYEDGLLLGSTNEEVMNTTGLIFNKNNNTIVLDENPVDEPVTLYGYILDISGAEKKLMDIVQYTATEKTIININLSTLTPAVDNNININITDVEGNLLQTIGIVNVSVNGEETTHYFINGKLSIPYKIMSSEGLTISAVYGGSDQYSRSSATVVFIGTNMTMTAQAETKVNSAIPVTIILTADDNLLTGQEVTISTTNGDETIELTKGFIIYQYTPTTVGEETITVTLNSNGSYIVSTANATITVTEDKDAIIEEQTNTINNLNNTIQNLNNTITEQNNTINNLNNTIENLTNTIEEQNNTIQNLNNTIQEQNNTITEQNNTIQNLNNTITEQNNTIQNLTNTVEDQANTISTLNDTVNALNNTIQEQNNTIENLNNTIEEQASTINNLNNTVQEQNNTITDLNKTITEQANIIDTLNNTIEEQAGTISDLNNTIQEQTGTITSLNDTVNNLNNTVEEQASTINDLNSTVQQQNATINDLQEQIDELKAPKNTTLTLDEITDAKYNGEVTITGTLVNEDSIGLFNQDILLTIGDEEITVKTKGGVFEYTTVFKELGEKTVTAKYAGSDKYQASEATTTFNVEKQDVIITYDTIQDAKYKDNITINGKVTDVNGKALYNINTIIKINDKLFKAKTDKTGAFTFTTTASAVGTNNVTLSYGGNANYNSYETTTTFNVEKQDIIITYDTIQDTKYKDNITITGKITDVNGKALSNINVIIKINGKTYKAKTDSTGAFTLTATASTIGTNNVTISYGGNANYNSNETITSFNVEKQDIAIECDAIADTVSGEDVTITGVASDVNGNSLNNINVNIRINDKLFKAKTDSTGAFTLITTVSAVGTNFVTLSYGGNANYNSCETITTFHVIAKN